MNEIKATFKEEDYWVLQEFVIRNVTYNSVLKFESGRQTSSMNLGSILRLGFELKANILNEQPPVDETEEEAENADNEA